MTEGFIGGGAETAEMGLIAHMLVIGMLIYSAGTSGGHTLHTLRSGRRQGRRQGAKTKGKNVRGAYSAEGRGTVRQSKKGKKHHLTGRGY